MTPKLEINFTINFFFKKKIEDKHRSINVWPAAYCEKNEIVFGRHDG